MGIVIWPATKDKDPIECVGAAKSTRFYFRIDGRPEVIPPGGTSGRSIAPPMGFGAVSPPRGAFRLEGRTDVNPPAEQTGQIKEKRGNPGHCYLLPQTSHKGHLALVAPSKGVLPERGCGIAYREGISRVGQYAAMRYPPQTIYSTSDANVRRLPWIRSTLIARTEEVGLWKSRLRLLGDYRAAKLKIPLLRRQRTALL